jgi:Reverse transcriptase (RNA-dependent DNA polymerase)
MVTHTKDNTRKPKKFPDHQAYLTYLDTEPTTFAQANTCAQWCAAMAHEITILAQNQTRSLVLSAAQNIIGCKWVFKIKRRSDGSIERYKARLVAKGFHQQEGIDIQDTFNPVIRPTIIKLVLSIDVSLKWSIRQLDVHNTFLHGDLHDQVFMSQPQGFVDSF